MTFLLFVTIEKGVVYDDKRDGWKNLSNRQKNLWL